MFRALLLIVLTAASSASFAEVDFTDAQLVQMGTAFIEAKNARQQPDSDAEDIERFLALLADEFIDEHIRFGVTLTNKNDLRAGMMQKLHDEVFYSRIEIEQIMTGRNVAFVKYIESARVKPSHLDKVIEYTSVNIVSLEFDEQGLIKHIRRHHG